MGWKEWVATTAVVAAVTGAVVWTNWERANRPEGPASRPSEQDRDRRCTGLQGDPADRVRRCLEDVARSTLSEPLSKLLEDIGDDSSVLSLARFDAGFPLTHLGEVEGLEAALLDDDEHAVAKRVRSAGIRGLVVHRDLTNALDRDAAVLARLAHHDHLEWFQLRYVTSDLFVYTVRSSRVRLPVDTGDRLLKGLRARLAGSPLLPTQRWDPETLRLVGTMRLQGQTLVSRHVVAARDGNARRPPSERALDELADKMARDWERKVETQGHGALSERLDELRLEIHVVMEKAPVEPRSRFEIFELWEMGIDGMMFRQREPAPGETLDEKFTFLPGSELVTRSIRSADDFLKAAAREFGWRDERPWEKDPRTRLDIVRDQHFMESKPGGPAVRLVRGMPEVPLEHVTDRNVQDMLVAGGEWWLANQYPDGKFEYKYWPEQNRRSTDYNEVRHILGSRDLADVWRYRSDDRYLAGARRAMDWLLKYEVDARNPREGALPHPPEGTTLFRFPSYAEATPTEPVNQKLGTVAVALLGWVAWAEVTGDHSEDVRIRKMAKFVVAMQEPDGRFKPYHIQPGHPYERERNDIVPGEAMLALGKVAEYFDEPDWIGDRYDKFKAYYEPWFRTRAVRRVPTGRWPHAIYEHQDRLDLVQFGPWSVMAANQVHRLTKNPAAAEFGLEVADWMIDSYQWTAERSPWPDYVGGYYKLPEELPAMQTFCYSEGTAAAYALATRFAPERKGKYEQATKEAIRFLEVMQFDELDSVFAPLPEKIRGGIKYTMNEEKVRIDYVGHGLSTLVQWLDARRDDPSVTFDVADPADLARAAGRIGSVPNVSYTERVWNLPSGEWPGTVPEEAPPGETEEAAGAAPAGGTVPAPVPVEKDPEKDDRE